MIRLQTGGEPSGKTDRGAEAGNHANFLRDGNEILRLHEFRDGRGHFRSDARGQRGEGVGGGFGGEQPVAELTYGEAGDGRESVAIVSVQDQAGYVVGFVGDDGFGEERGEREIRQGEAGGYAFFLRRGGNAGELVAGTKWRGFGEEFAEGEEVVGGAADGVAKGHGGWLGFRDGV